jgi:hypothetical protein
LARLKSARDKATPGSAVESWASRARELKEQLAQRPEAATPEFQFLTEEDWLAAARKNLDGEANMRRAFSEVRGAGERKFVSLLSKALKKYSDDNGKQAPTDLSLLQGYFEERLDESILQRWEIAPAETVPTVSFGSEVIITQKAAADGHERTHRGHSRSGLFSDVVNRVRRSESQPWIIMLQLFDQRRQPKVDSAHLAKRLRDRDADVGRFIGQSRMQERLGGTGGSSKISQSRRRPIANRAILITQTFDQPWHGEKGCN